MMTTNGKARQCKMQNIDRPIADLSKTPVEIINAIAPALGNLSNNTQFPVACWPIETQPLQRPFRPTQQPF
jgi:hypothetical protein